MGYFSNGDEGDRYEAEYCAHCIHNDGEDGCPVWHAHLLFSYEECGSKSNAATMLQMLIPRKGIVNGTCTMFVQRTDVTTGR